MKVQHFQSTHFKYLILLLLTLPLFSTAQQQIVTAVNGNEVEFSHPSTINNNTAYFWLFGDGNYSLSSTPLHNYAEQGNYPVELHHVVVNTGCCDDPYDIEPPMVVGTNVNLSQGGSVTAQTLANPIQLSTSWNAAPDDYVILIASFKNPDPNNPGEGKFVFNYDETVFDKVEIRDNELNRWDNLTPNNGTYSNDQIVFTPADDVQHIFIKLHTITEAIIESTTMVEATITNVFSSVQSGSNLSLMIHAFPHDPNMKLVDKTEILPNHNAPQTLKYRITFHNDGEYFVNTVRIEDEIDIDRLDINSIRILNSSATVNHSVNGNLLEFTFPNIQLPGIDQIAPRSYNYDETTGFVEFTIDAIESLPYPDTIRNKANIFFDALAPIETHNAVTITNKNGDEPPTKGPKIPTWGFVIAALLIVIVGYRFFKK